MHRYLHTVDQGNSVQSWFYPEYLARLVFLGLLRPGLSLIFFYLFFCSLNSFSSLVIGATVEPWEGECLTTRVPVPSTEITVQRLVFRPSPQTH